MVQQVSFNNLFDEHIIFKMSSLTVKQLYQIGAELFTIPTINSSRSGIYHTSSRWGRENIIFESHTF